MRVIDEKAERELVKLIGLVKLRNELLKQLYEVMREIDEIMANDGGEQSGEG